MTHLPSLPEDAKLLDVFRAYPDTARPLIDYLQALMRGASPLSEAHRELIAAYVSGLNACDYCHGIHQTTTQAFGVDEGLLTALLEDLEMGRAGPSRRRGPRLRPARQPGDPGPGQDHSGYACAPDSAR